MSTLIQSVLDRADVLAQSPYANGSHSMSVDAVLGTDAALERADRHVQTISRALANQTTADNAGRLGVAPALAPQVAASAPVLAALATPLGVAPGKPQLGTWPTIAAVIDPAEKTVITSPMVGSAVKAVTLRTSAAAVNVSRQLEDWAVDGFTLDAALSASVLAKLEGQLLADLAAGVTPAADLAAALAACNPAATHVVGNMADLVVLATVLAGLGQAGLLPRVVATPNASAVLVLSLPAVTIAASPVRVGTQIEPGLIGIGVAAYAYGYAGTGVAEAVQIIG